MIKTCRYCGKRFEVTDTFFSVKKYCNDLCRHRAEKFKQYLRDHFDDEFAAWKRDFAAGKTQSNLTEVKRCG